MTNADEFLKFFNKIESTFRRRCNSTKHKNFRAQLDWMSRHDKLINSHKDDLEQLAKLRNAIVHGKTDEHIAEPHDSTVLLIKKIYKRIAYPPKAESIASKPVFCAKTDDLIADVIKEMTKNVFTSVPIHEGSKFVGVFSESSITKWLGNSVKKDSFVLGHTKINELLEYLDQPDDAFNGYTFISKKTNVFEVSGAFLSSVSNRRRLGAAFITKTGRKNEKILGIITAWDLPKIENLQNR